MAPSPRLGPALAAIASLALASDAGAQRPGRPLLDEVVQAMGGRDRIAAVRTLVVEGTGENFSLGQNLAPDSSLPVFAVTEHRRLYDFANRRWRIEQVREPRYPAGNQAPQRQRAGFDAGVAYEIAPDNSLRRSTAQADADRAADLLLHPVGFAQAAMAPGVELVEDAARDGMRQLRASIGGQRFTVLVDPATKLPARIERSVHNAMLGDATFEQRFSDWREVDGVRVPMRVDQRLDGRYPLTDIRYSAVRVNGDIGDLAATAEVRGAPPVAPPAPTVAVEEIAPGIWYLTGGSHHSVAIEMRDHLLLVEAPLNDDRTLAVVRRARELRPGKPVRAVVNTHHHFDHAGGIRAAISEGLAVVTHEGNRRFYDSLARRRFSIAPDAQAAADRPATIEAVGAKRVITDGSRTVELHHVPGSTHSSTMLVVYLPAEHMLIEADAYNPPAPNAANAPPAPFASNLVEVIDRLGLEVERVAALHGRVIPMSDIRAAADAWQRRR